MATPELRWYASDGVTPVGKLTLQPVGPGENYKTKYGAPVNYVLKNTGATSLTVTVEITQISTDVGYEYALIAVGETEPAEIDFVDHLTDPLAVGVVPAAGSVRIWVNVDVPLSATRGYVRRVNLEASGS
jgi:hypothetical protein